MTEPDPDCLEKAAWWPGEVYWGHRETWWEEGKKKGAISMIRPQTLQQDATRSTFQAAEPRLHCCRWRSDRGKKKYGSWRSQEDSTYGSAGSGCHIFYPTLIHFLQRSDPFTGFQTLTFSDLSGPSLGIKGSPGQRSSSVELLNWSVGPGL